MKERQNSKISKESDRISTNVSTKESKRPDDGFFAEVNI